MIKFSKNIVLCNSFSIQMLDVNLMSNVVFAPVDVDFVKDVVSSHSFTSAIGHADTANVVGDMLGVNVASNRVDVKLDFNTILLVAQIVGGRLPAGTTTLPSGFAIKFFAVTLKSTSKTIDVPTIDVGFDCGDFTDCDMTCDKCPVNL